MKNTVSKYTMTLAFLVSAIAFLNPRFANAAPDPNAHLVSMQIIFDTLNNDLDHDTRLEVWINKAGEKEAAYLDVKHNGFPNDSTHVYDVPKKSNTMMRSEIPGSWVQIRIHPSDGHGGPGKDTWNFKCRVMLRFDDGTIYEKAFDLTTLDQDANQSKLSL